MYPRGVSWIAGKTCLITGATRGIGRATAVELAAQGAELFLVARDRQRAEETLDEIRERTPDAKVELLYADLSSMRSVRLLADAFLAKETPLHVLLNNAGAVFLERQETVDGFERTLALNHQDPG